MAHLNSDLELWPSDPKIHRVHLLPRMEVWTKFKEGRSRCSRSYWWETKRLQTDMCKAICPLFFKVGHNYG